MLYQKGSLATTHARSSVYASLHPKSCQLAMQSDALPYADRLAHGNRFLDCLDIKQIGALAYCIKACSLTHLSSLADWLTM